MLHKYHANMVEVNIYIIIRYWMVRWFFLWFCLFAIEATFPLSNFKTKHIFGILMERVKFLKPFGEPQAPPRRGAGGAPNFCLYFFIAAEGGVSCHQRLHKLQPQIFDFYNFFHRRRRQRFPKWAAQAPQRGRRSPGGWGKSRQRRVFCELFIIM